MLDPIPRETQLHYWARVMAHLQARACVISKITGMSNAAARKLWHEEMGRGSPSGQQPTDTQWFLKSPLRRTHAALLLQLYAHSTKSLPSYAAFAHSYYHYARLTAGLFPRSSWDTDPAFRATEDDYVVPFSRGFFLASIYSDDMTADGRRKCVLENRKCRACGCLYLGHIEEAGRYCPTCASKKGS